jgi:hypothetical protein
VFFSSKEAVRQNEISQRKHKALADALSDKIDEKFEELLKSVLSEVKKKSTQRNQD